ncbi:hypothetical protein C8Q80DRAFT_1273860 [Daedaleopsis nitida]|nr:hypothetical protein C8Q80DRAFT_1273860 [Daedaleopsis nitida]
MSSQPLPIYQSTRAAHPRRTFPPEIVHQIIHELWYEPQSPQDRAYLSKSICLVSHTWLCLYTRVAMRDVHLPLSLSANTLLNLLPDRTPTQEKGLFIEAAAEVTNYMCQSLTFHVDARVAANTQDLSPSPPAIKYFSAIDPAANAVSSVLAAIPPQGPDCLPNLHHISIKYTDWAFEALFDLLGTHPLPAQITHLSLDFVFDKKSTGALASYISTTFLREGHPVLEMPDVRHLSVRGMPAEIISDLLDSMPNLETLTIGGCSRLDVIGALPESVHTLVLSHPGEALTALDMQWWELDMALSLGLSEGNAGFRVIVRSGTPDPFSFSDMKRFCKWYGVDLSYERVDVSENW